jgi:hypothetical protein
VSDQYSSEENIKLEIDDSIVNYDVIGIYPIHIYATDESGNVGILHTELIILDIHAPTLTLKSNVYYANIHAPLVDLSSYILDAYDNYEDLDRHDVEIFHEININKIGVYLVKFQLVDESMNKSISILEYRIDDINKPQISFEPLILSYRESFLPMTGVTIYEHSSKVSISIFPSIVDTTVPGSYQITYIATDERGNSTKLNRMVTVLPERTNIEVTMYLPVLSIILIGGASTFYFWKKL